MDLVWRKPELSNPSGSCVELARLPDGAVGVRNSRHPDGPVLAFTRPEWDAFTIGLRTGEFDYLTDGHPAEVAEPGTG